MVHRSRLDSARDGFAPACLERDGRSSTGHLPLTKGTAMGRESDVGSARSKKLPSVRRRAKRTATPFTTSTCSRRRPQLGFGTSQTLARWPGLYEGRDRWRSRRHGRIHRYANRRVTRARTPFRRLPEPVDTISASNTCPKAREVSVHVPRTPGSP